MRNSYATYQHIVKTAAPLIFRATSSALNLPGIYGGISGRVSTGLHGLGGIRDSAYGAVGTAADTFNVFETPAQREKSVAHTIGKEIGNFFLPKVFDPDDLGPYEEYSDYLKDTEQGEMYLNQAAVLRRAARKVLRKRKQQEMEKEHASSSRYF